MLITNKTKILSSEKLLLRPFNINDVGDMYSSWSNDINTINLI